MPIYLPMSKDMNLQIKFIVYHVALQLWEKMIDAAVFGFYSLFSLSD